MILKNDNDMQVRQCSLPLIFAVTSETSNEMANQIKDGVLYWNDALGKETFLYGGHVNFGINDPFGGGFLAVGIVPDLPQYRNVYPCAITRMNVATNGCVMRVLIKIRKSCTSDPDVLQTIVRHEVGHVLGLNNSSDFTTLMSCRLEETMQHPVDATEEEVKAVKQLYGLQ
jgi:hypothetical protein